MNTGAVPSCIGRERARACVGLIGEPAKGLGDWWADADGAMRRMLLRIAAADESMWSYHWRALPEPTRAALVARAFNLRDWLVKVLPW